MAAEDSEQIQEVRPTIDQLTLISGGSGDQLICPICQKRFKNRGSRRFHLDRTHNLQVESLEVQMGLQPGPIERSLRFFCPLENCPAIRNRNGYFGTAKLLIQHFQKAHYEKRHKCANCSARFSLERDLRYHRTKKCPNRVSGGREDENCNKQSCESSNNARGLEGSRQCAKNTATQTEKWLVPTRVVIIGNYKKIRSRKPLALKSISTQTVSSEYEPSEAISYFYGAPQMTDQIAQVESMDLAIDGIVGNNNYHQQQQQYQHSYAQTNYLQTLDFGMQHPAGGATAYEGSGQQQHIYLNPLQNASTHQQTQQISPMFISNEIFDGTAESSIRHCETQTPTFCERADEDGFTCLWGMATVAAQTDLSSDADWSQIPIPTP